MVKLNAEKDTVTAARYRVKSYPTVMVLRKDGTEMDRIVGYYRAPEFISQVEDYLAGRNTLASYAAMEPDSGSDPGYMARLAERYLYHGDDEQASKRFHRVIEIDPQNRSGLVDDALYQLARLSRRNKDYAADRRYAQRIIERYPTSDMYRAAILEVAGAYRREGKLKDALPIYIDYAKRFPDDEDTPFAKEQVDSLRIRIQRGEGA
jgi:tetratricopeptide (TPR) repeat protein